MKTLLTSLFIFFFSFNIFSQQKIEVIVFDGIPCIVHNVKIGENVYELGRYYNTRPATINLINNLDNTASLKGIKEIFVPLTETNYFTSLGINDDDKNYITLYYSKKINESIDDISTLFFVSISKLKKWNNDNFDNKIKIGYVKISTNKQDVPMFIVAEKKFFVEQIKNSEIEKQESSIARKNFIDLKKELPIAKNDINKSIVKKSTVETQIIKPKIIEEKKQENQSVKNNSDLNIDINPEKKIEKYTTTSITKKAPINLFEKEREREKASFVKSLFKSSNSYKKEKERALKNKIIVNNTIKKEVVENKNVLKVDVIKNNIEEIKEVKFVEPTENIALNTSKNKIEPVEDKNKVVVVENSLQRLSLNNTSKGKGAYFFSGNIGGRFYVFTNLVSKGSIVKVMNNKNKKYILAEVMSSLPNKDVQNGFLIKISENAKYPLGQEKGNLDVSIFY